MYSKRLQRRLIKAEINKIENDISNNINDINIIENEQDKRIYENDMEFGNYIEENVKSLVGDLADWAVQNNITRVALNNLLKVLRNWNIDLPESAQSLVKTKQYAIRTVSPGSYVHFGVQNELRKVGSALTKQKKIQLDIGIDGLPLYKSSQTSLWPILGKIVPQLNTDILLFGVYVGKKKPFNVNCCLHDFVSEMTDILANGVAINNQVIKVTIRAFVCDAPAKAFLTQTLGHNALNGCSRCLQEGKTIKNTTVYSTFKSTPHTDNDFSQRKDQSFHKEIPDDRLLLENINIKMVSQFPLDPMHLIDLGIMKKMLLTLYNGRHLTVDNLKTEKKILKKEKKKHLNNRIMAIKDFIPVDFARKPRELDELCRWKATEFRQFALYTGIYILKDIVETDMYDHFILLHCAYRLIMTEKTYLANLNVATDMIQYFVQLFPQIYGQEKVTYNVHSLLHLTECIEEIGFVNSFAAYSFENYMQKLKKFVKKPTRILEQIANKNQYTNPITKEKQLGIKKN